MVVGGRPEGEFLGNPVVSGASLLTENAQAFWASPTTESGSFPKSGAQGHLIWTQNGRIPDSFPKQDPPVIETLV